MPQWFLIVVGLVVSVLGVLITRHAVGVSAFIRDGMPEFLRGAATPTLARILGLGWVAFGVLWIIVAITSGRDV